MALPKKSVIFETLNNQRHTCADGTQLDMFCHTDTSATKNAEYWLYSDLYNLFGHPYITLYPTIPHHTWNNLVMPIGNKSHPEMTKPTIDFYNGHVATIHHPYKIGPHTSVKKGTDQELSRYACWCLTRHNPNMIFARTYFISPAINPDMSFDNMKQLSYQFARVGLREQLKEYEKQVGGILNSTNGHFSLFNHNMTRAFFYGYDANTLKDIYKIPIKSNDPISNYMGAGALHARICALRDAIAEFRTSKSQNTNTFDAILHKHLTNQRIKLIHDTDIRPEQDIFTTPVSQIKSQLNRTEQDFITQYSKIKIR